MTRRASDGQTVVRPATADDEPAVTTLVSRAVTESPWVDGPRYFLQRAFTHGGDDARCLLAEREHTIVGCVLYGVVAGTVGTARLQYVAVASHLRRSSIGTALCDAAVRDLTAAGVRRVIVEMPDDGSLLAARRLFEACGFREIASVGDYYRDRVNLTLLEHRTSSA